MPIEPHQFSAYTDVGRCGRTTVALGQEAEVFLSFLRTKLRKGLPGTAFASTLAFLAASWHDSSLQDDAPVEHASPQIPQMRTNLVRSDRLSDEWQDIPLPPEVVLPATFR